MSTVTIPGSDIEFFFTDTGAPGSVKDYTTLIIVHGHTYHANLFQRLLPLAASRSVRIICINRREYPGSTPHTPEELRMWASGTEDERTKLVRDFGINHLLCVDEIIQKCALPSAGKVAIIAWSLGNTFNLAAVASILSIPSKARERLQAFVKTIVMWDAPSQSLGIISPPKGYVPLYDEELAPEARGPEFGKWLESYFIHGDLTSRDPDELNYRNPDPARKRSFQDLPIPQLLEITDFTVGDKCDTVLVTPSFQPMVKAAIDKALFDPEVRAAWKNAHYHYVFGMANAWNIHWALWDVEDRVKAAKGKAPIEFHPVEVSNHFGMWDYPTELLDQLIACTKS